MITSQLPSRRRIWSSRYCNQKKRVVESREIRRKQAEKERKAYLPQFVSSTSVDSFIDREEEIEPVPFSFLKHGRRNKLCSICAQNAENEDDDTTIMKCDLCPAVAHENCSHCSSAHSCLSDYIDHFTEKYLTHVKERKGDRSVVWSCRLCSKELSESIHQEQERLRIDRFNRTAYFSAVKLQASCMRKRAQHKYQILYNGMLRLQARCRGVQRRSSFMKEFTLSCRSFRIKNLSYELADTNQDPDKPVISCIMCIINNESDLDDSERQMYRFDSQGVQHQSLNGRWNDTFMVYSSSTKIKFSLTVHGKEYETSSSRSVFLGQYALDASDQLKHSFFTGRPTRFQGPLGKMVHEPKDQKFSSISPSSSSTGGSSSTAASASASATTSTTSITNSLGGGGIGRSGSANSTNSNTNTNNNNNNQLGRCSFEIYPISNVESKCGTLEEILSSALLRKGARKKWYAVLSDRQLFLFGQMADSRPKVTITLQQVPVPVHAQNHNHNHNHNHNQQQSQSQQQQQSASDIEWYDENCNIIKISNHTSNQQWLLTSGNVQQLKAWYIKLTGTYRKKLHNEGRMFKLKKESSSNSSRSSFSSSNTNSSSSITSNSQEETPQNNE